MKKNVKLIILIVTFIILLLSLYKNPQLITNTTFQENLLQTSEQIDQTIQDIEFQEKSYQIDSDKQENLQIDSDKSEKTRIDLDKIEENI